MRRDKPPPLKCEVTRYNGKEIAVKTMTREEAEAIDLKSFDYYIASAFGKIGFRTASGKWVEYCNGRRPGIGPEGLNLTRAIQLNPGVHLRSLDLAELTGNEDFCGPNCVSAVVLRLRRAHSESKQKQHFFFTGDSGEMTVCWPAEKKWIWIDAFRSASAEKSNGRGSVTDGEDKTQGI
jgi:hypothetical protein